MKKKPEKPIQCYYGAPWLDHFDPPIGTGKGCSYCHPEQILADADGLTKAIAAWREDDSAGYHTAIGLLCRAEDMLQILSDAIRVVHNDNR